MKYTVTEYLRIDLEKELWECRVCERELGDAHENYKRFTRIYNRDPREIHPPKLDPERYEYTFSPNPRVCAIYEFYCPGCGTMMDVEYTVPGHMPLHDIELDIEALQRKMRGQPDVTNPGVGEDAGAALRYRVHRHDSSSHSHDAQKNKRDTP